MSNKKISSEEELYKRMGVNSVQEIANNKEKINSFLAMHSQINPGVMGMVISGIPDSVEALVKMASGVAQIFEEDYKGVSDKDAVKAYNEILRYLKKEANKEGLSSEEKNNLKEEMYVIIEKIEKNDKIKEDERREIRDKKMMMIAFFALVIVIAVALIIIFSIVPGFVAETLTIILGIVILVALISNYRIKVKEIKLKYKNMK